MCRLKTVSRLDRPCSHCHQATRLSYHPYCATCRSQARRREYERYKAHHEAMYGKRPVGRPRKIEPRVAERRLGEM